MFENLEIHKKLKSKDGFNLAETLMTVLLLTIVLSAVTGGIMAAQRAYRKIRMKADAEMLLATTITELSTEFERARNLKGIDAVPATNDPITTFYSEYRGGMTTFTSGEGTTGIIATTVLEGSEVTAELANEKTRGLSTLYTKFIDDSGADSTPVFKRDTASNTEQSSGFIQFTVGVFNKTADGRDQLITHQVVKVRPVLCQ